MSGRNLKVLAPKHQQLARLLVAGNSQAEAARLLSMDKSTVSRLSRDPLVHQEIKRLQTFADSNVAVSAPGVPEKISEGAQRSIEVLLEILEDERTDHDILKLKANVSCEILNRAGFVAVKQMRVESASVSTFLTPEELDGMKNRALEELKRKRYNSNKMEQENQKLHQMLEEAKEGKRT